MSTNGAQERVQNETVNICWLFFFFFFRLGAMFMKSIYITWVFSKQLFEIYQGLCVQKAYENYIN